MTTKQEWIEKDLKYVWHPDTQHKQYEGKDFKPTIIEKGEENEIYATMPLGMIVVRDDFFITVSLRKNKIIESFEKRNC